VRVAAAEHSSFAFRSNRFELVRNGQAPVFDEFADGVLAPWILTNGFVREEGGGLTFSDPGGHDQSFTPLLPLELDRSDTSAPSSFDVAEGQGDFVAESTWAPIVPQQPGQAFGMVLEYDLQGGAEREWVVGYVANWHNAIASMMETAPGLILAQIRFRGFAGNFTAIDQTSWYQISPTQLLSDIVIRMEFDDSTDSIRTLFSLDGGSSYLDPFPIPINTRLGQAPSPGRWSLHASSQSLVPISHLALGDSYSSGEGAGSYFWGTDVPFINRCHRSEHAYPPLLRPPPHSQTVKEISEEGVHPNFSWDFFACSGATTRNVKPANSGGTSPDKGPDEPPQLDRPEVGSANLVTITIGGNDASFATVLSHCMAKSNCFAEPVEGLTDDLPLYEWLPNHIRGQVKNDLSNLFQDLRDHSANGTILVVGYPQIVSARETCAEVSSFLVYELDVPEQTFLRIWGNDLQRVLAEAASGAGVHFVWDVSQRFTGHELCGDLDDWIIGIGAQCKFFSNSECAHPTPAGQQAIQRAIRDYVGSWPFGRLPNGLPINPVPSGTPSISSAFQSIQSTEPTTFGDLGVASAGSSPCVTEPVFLPGQSVRVSGTGYGAGASVAVRFVADGPTILLGTTTADGSGEVDVEVAIPASAVAPSIAVLSAAGEGAVASKHYLSRGIAIASDFIQDSDSDGVPDLCDNCPSIPGAQEDADGDGLGDPCDACPQDAENDSDGDGVCATLDPCPLDALDDADADGYCTDDDNCPEVLNPDQADSDRDGRGDACQSATACGDAIDNDGDGVSDQDDPGCDDEQDTSERSLLLPCDDGLDNDADGVADYRMGSFGDPGCRDPSWNRENPQCDDDVDNDGDGTVDWDGGVNGGMPDPTCRVGYGAHEKKCGLGFEVSLIALLMLAPRYRRRAEIEGTQSNA
jgi:hypothetical protein